MYKGCRVTLTRYQYIDIDLLISLYRYIDTESIWDIDDFCMLWCTVIVQNARCPYSYCKWCAWFNQEVVRM